MKYIFSSAVISADNTYRYELVRRWKEENLPTATFIGLNPSTADAYKDDATIRRCVSFADSWGCGSMVMLNIFALRSTNPQNLCYPHTLDPVGPENDNYLKGCNGLIVAMWGNWGRLLNRSADVRSWLKNVQCFGLTKENEPKHILYLSSSALLRPL